MGRYRGDLNWLTARPIAHRGYHDMNNEVWENTLSAFDRAIERDFAIECDLQLACDGVPVVFHDDDLSRLCGLQDDVRLLTSQELAMKRIGRTKDAIPTLGKLLDRAAGRVPIVLELKGRKGEDDGFVGAVLEELEDYDGPVAIMSFDHWLLEELVELDCPYPVGLTAEGIREEKFAEHEQMMKLGLDFVSYGILHMPNRFITEARRAGTPVITWTVRTPDMRERTEQEADQMTFEGFDPDAA
ncbi:glycerophosphodiester phosphodiesterase [Pseudohoeflea suaedae]|uniref:Glycerophosphodiester phosphodiesterase n=1 Tax=Pseudohoeflea suaedae TaxID=877384 RepID=A0A4R5PKD3_9HYPH|nr:glycerophosphodiester phosphodiesterase [Pseudohoeflea suaedae]TDH36173.1 glycerophosphodiester phosphodiesterase [Pseudohoeflea suaedae]